MTYHCTHCQAEQVAPVRPLLDDRYATGYCAACRKHQVFRRWASGEALRDAGMAQAALNADQGVDAAWRSAATDVVRVLAASGQAFTVEDVTREVGLPAHHPNAVGALINTLARQGVIEWTGEFREAQRPSRHSNQNRVWRGRRAA